MIIHQPVRIFQSQLPQFAFRKKVQIFSVQIILSRERMELTDCSIVRSSSLSLYCLTMLQTWSAYSCKYRYWGNVSQSICENSSFFASQITTMTVVSDLIVWLWSTSYALSYTMCHSSNGWVLVKIYQFEKKVKKSICAHRKSSLWLLTSVMQQPSGWSKWY